MKIIEHGAGALKPKVEARGKIYDSVVDTIGATPLVRLPRLSEKYKLQAEIFAKLEFFNPLSSVKDRIAFAMIEAAERDGKIQPGQSVLVEPTSGNTGVGLAFVAATKGYRLILVMPESMSVERRKMLRLMGAELILTPAERGMKGAIDRAAEIAAKTENSFIVGQFDNPANPQIHRETTAEEIWADTEGQVDILVSGVGTGGTLTGTAQVLKQRKAGVLAYAVEPMDSPVLSGGQPGPHKIQGIGAGFVPKILDQSLIDGIVKITNDEAFSMAREAAAIEGIACGISSGAAIAAAIKVAQVPDHQGKKIVTILASSADRYLSTGLFEGLL